MAIFGFGNRRRHERVRPAFDGEITVDVLYADRATPSVLVDVSAGGSALVVPKPLAALIDGNEQVRLRFRLPDYGLELETTGVIRWRNNTAGGQELGVEFVDAEPLLAQLRGHWWRYFNRRRCGRVDCTLGRPITGRLVGGGTSAVVDLVDLSPAGASVRLDPELGARVDGATGLRLALLLDPEPTSLRLVADCVHSFSEERTAHVGLVFDARRSPDFTFQEELVNRWVAGHRPMAPGAAPAAPSAVRRARRG